MKNIKEFIIESSKRFETKFEKTIAKNYKDINSFNDGDDIIVLWIDDDNLAHPFNAIVKKHNNDIIFVNPDDDRDMLEFRSLVFKMSGKNILIATFDDVKTAEDASKLYNENN